jgi:hypothetical protein
MEIVLLFACILVAVALAGDSLLGLLIVCAACQLACVLGWVFIGSAPWRASRRSWWA